MTVVHPSSPGASLSRASVPRVSVLTAVHNGERYLDATIISVLAQTYTDFEYILVDDGSQDSSPAILAKWAARDARIRVVRNETPLNPAGALNRALAEARGEFVAILDHDDLNFPTRLADEVAFLDANPAIGAVGGQVNVINDTGELISRFIVPTEPVLCRWACAFSAPTMHLTMMVRREFMEQVGGYSPTYWAAPDLDIMLRLIRVTQFANLPTTLGAWRRSRHQVSTRHTRVQRAQIIFLLRDYWYECYGLNAPFPTLALLFFILGGVVEFGREQDLQEALSLFNIYHETFLARESLTEAEEALIRRDIALRYLTIAVANRRTQRAASRELLGRALELDPDLWANTADYLRNIHYTRRWYQKKKFVLSRSS